MTEAGSSAATAAAGHAAEGEDVSLVGAIDPAINGCGEALAHRQPVFLDGGVRAVYGRRPNREAPNPVKFTVGNKALCLFLPRCIIQQIQLALEQHRHRGQQALGQIHLTGDSFDLIQHPCAMLMEGVANQIHLIEHGEEQPSGEDLQGQKTAFLGVLFNAVEKVDDLIEAFRTNGFQPSWENVIK